MKWPSDTFLPSLTVGAMILVSINSLGDGLVEFVELLDLLGFIGLLELLGLLEVLEVRNLGT